MIQKMKLVLLFVVVASLGTAYGQVTVGSDVAPERAALLEIKDQAADADNVTAKTGGLGLPRVELADKTTLEPFIATGDAEWTNAATQATLKTKHAGLMVYNLYESPSSVTESNKKFKPGVYVWNGTEWGTVGSGSGGEGRYFYIPSFNIPLATPSATELTFDLYAQYKAQFTQSGNTTFVSNNATLYTTVPSPETGTLYTASELDYIITYYDDTVIDVTGLTNDGKMTYKVVSQETSPASFLNVVFVVKE